MENISQNIPATAKVERGADEEWILTVKLSLPMQINTWLNSCQNRENPAFQDRKSVESMEIAKGKITPLPPRIRAPVRKPMQSSPSPKTSSNYELPTRMQTQKRMQNGNKVPPPAQGCVKPGKEKETQKLSVGISKASKEGKVTAARAFVTSPASITSPAFIASPASITSPDRPTVLNALDDSAFVKWIKSEILKARNGLWSTRLQVLYKEKFKKVLPARIIEELKFRPDIAKIEEPIPGRYLLYAPQLQQQQQEQQHVQSAVPKANQEDQSRVNVCSDFTLPHFLPDVGSSVIVYVSVTEHPGCFYVSHVDALLENLSVEIRERYKSTRSVPGAIPTISPGQFLCAQFTEDGNFYRACVLEVMDSRHVKVLYVDFGNKEIIPVTSLRVLISDFRAQPIQAFECCLDGIQPIDQGHKWSDAAICKFDDLTCEKELRMTVLDVDELDIAEEMKKAGQAISTQNLELVSSSSSSSLSFSSGHMLERSPWRTDTVATRLRRLKTKSPGIVELPEDQFLDVFVCNITGTYDIYLRLVGEEYSVRPNIRSSENDIVTVDELVEILTRVDKLSESNLINPNQLLFSFNENTKFEAIQESMTSYYSDLKDEIITDPVVGKLFALISDEVWCRVRVVSVNGGKIQVFFVDHGDTTETTKAELRPLAPQFRQLPFQVFQCALDGLPKTKNPDVVDKLKNLIMGKVAVAEVVKKTGDLVFIELLDTRTDAAIPVNAVVRKLVIPDEELKPVLPKVGHTVDVEIAYISETGSVFLHVSAAGSKRLEELNKDLTDHYTSKLSKAYEFISIPTVGKVCCAKCADDGNWYRAKILSFDDKDMIEVLYVDFGNTEVVPVMNLREPTQNNAHVLSLPFQACECQLYDVPEDGWNDELIDTIFEIVEQGTLAAEVLSDGDPPLISLLVTEEFEGEIFTHRLATLLGFADSEDMYEDDDTDEAEETEID